MGWLERVARAPHDDDAAAPSFTPGACRRSTSPLSNAASTRGAVDRRIRYGSFIPLDTTGRLWAAAPRRARYPKQNVHQPRFAASGDSRGVRSCAHGHPSCRHLCSRHPHVACSNAHPARRNHRIDEARVAHRDLGDRGEGMARCSSNPSHGTAIRYPERDPRAASMTAVNPRRPG